ncbi:MAG: RNA polymerase sigma factor RpoD [Chitinophagales bacterium]|nr:MAG: RNA polymerase sigma factor RpoD [Chitinophagales bacterium]
MRQLKITNHITQRDNLALEKYLQEIAKEPLLTDEEEVELARRVRKGDPEALEKMVKANLRFVVSVAKQYQNQGLQLSDLINEGNLGLIKAAQKFDETKGFKFISYAVWWIRQSVLQALVEQSRIIRLPLNKIGSYNKITRAMYEFEQKYQREPTNEELEEILKINKKEIDDIIRSAHKHVSMDAPFSGSSNEEEESSLYDVIEGENPSDTQKEMMKESLKAEIRKALSVLPKRDAEIVSCYFGLRGEVHMTLEEIGKKFDLTRERVRQIKERSLRRLRKTTTSKALRTYLGE